MEKLGAVILAGGKSSRMGQNKALMIIRELTLIEHVYNIVSQFTNDILISANSSEYDFLNCQTVCDRYKNIGPVAGIYSGLIKSEYEKNIVISCDTPFVSKEILEKIISKSGNFEITITRHKKFLNPLIGIYSKKNIPVFKEAILNKNYSIRRIINKTKLNVIDIDKDIFNINNLDEFNLAKASKYLNDENKI